MKLAILYRGSLSSCNYGCEYCPFAKHHETRAEHERDARALTRFIDWVAGRVNDQISVFFTPWGEALIRQRYQQALIRLSNMPHVDRATIQTNLSSRLAWVDDCDKSKLALWTTYHPSETTRAKFVAKCLELDRRKVRFSVGVVGLTEHADEIERLRQELPDHIYLWINAYKRVDRYYDSGHLARFQAIDPLFPINNQRHPSLEKACRTGESVISVNEDGVIRRCHFIKTPIGNLYDPDFEQVLQPRLCTHQTCGCHIGYVHLDDLGLSAVFGNGILERIPSEPLWLRSQLGDDTH
ncbi:MAG: STM4011 family radical SAM protein [Anaerolineae bacterium]|nr:STM4011 family radical SAM protein [Anaerolineae bacterium]